jgi:hypothetical protein
MSFEEGKGRIGSAQLVSTSKALLQSPKLFGRANKTI